MDLSFDPGSGVTGPVGPIVIQPDGKIIIGGAMTMVRGVPCRHIARLNADGSLDGTFNPDHGTGYVDGLPSPATLALQPDGKVLVGGVIFAFHGVLRAYVARLHGDSAPRYNFLRGDCNGVGAVDISDAVFSLVSLIVGDGDPGCDDACDSNDDGAVDISDAIETLGVLFLGNGAIPVPGMADRGVNSTGDELGCQAFERCP